MPKPLFILFSYLRYLLKAGNAHGLHSPFVFKLYNETVKPTDKGLRKQAIDLRKTFFTDKSALAFTDPKTGIKSQSTVRDIAQKSASSLKFQLFLVQLIGFLGVKKVLETGTSVGVSAAVMSLAKSEIVTIEGSESIAKLAIKKFDELRLSIRVVQGNIFEVFEETLSQEKPDLVFLDADHRAASIRFYLDTLKKQTSRPTCILIHDIYWSKDMAAEWTAIQRSTDYALTIDLFQVGLIFPDYPMRKQHFTLRF